MSSKLDVLRALAADCRDHGDRDIAEGIEGIITGVEAMCEAVRTERKAADSGDTLAYIEARLATTLEMVLLAGAQGSEGPSHG